ncbi:MAG: hypothetical protein IJC02_04210 [Lachnospiraceae bacterium]|nr:hypothetical protein [Lachnospiraceae bacterium]MBQ6995971.1 hypothetical protein [Lachnospiraceae bacterium]
MKNKLTHNLGLKMLALIFSIGLWFVVNNITDPIGEKTFYNVPVEIINEDKIADEGKVYEVLEGTDAINVKVTGKKSIISYINKEDIKAVADLSELTFMNTVTIKVSSLKNNTELEFSASVDNMKLSIEDMKQVQKMINTSTAGAPAEGYIVGTVTPSQNVVRLSGPESLVEQIDRVEAVANISGYATDITSSVELKFCNAEGEEIESNSIKTNISTINVAVTILGTKEVPLKFAVQGKPKEGYVVRHQITKVPEKVKIAGRKNVLDSVSEINVADAALTVDGLSDDMTTVVNIRKYLPNGVQLAETSFDGNVSVTVGIEPLVTKEYDIPVKNFAVGNAPDGYEVYIREFENKEIKDYTISVSGVEDDIRKIKENDVIGVVDMQNIAETQGITEWTAGSYVGEITFNLSEGVILKAPYSLTVVLVDQNKETEESTKNEVIE